MVRCTKMLSLLQKCMKCKRVKRVCLRCKFSCYLNIIFQSFTGKFFWVTIEYFSEITKRKFKLKKSHYEQLLDASSVYNFLKWWAICCCSSKRIHLHCPRLIITSIFSNFALRQSIFDGVCEGFARLHLYNSTAKQFLVQIFKKRNLRYAWRLSLIRVSIFWYVDFFTMPPST